MLLKRVKKMGGNGFPESCGPRTGLGRSGGLLPSSSRQRFPHQGSGPSGPGEMQGEGDPTMLVLARRPEEKILFPTLGITIEILRVTGQVVRVGVEAPR